MKREKAQAVLIILCGLICVASGVYIYFEANTIYPSSTSSRVQNLNWLLKTFGKLPTSLLIGIIGFVFVCIGLKKIIKHNKV